MRIKKYVFDTNIFISYIITHKQLFLEQIVLNENLKKFYCVELMEELKRVLTYPNLKKYNFNISEAVHFVTSICYLHTLEYPTKRYIPTDEADNYIIASALQTNSGFVTSGDKDILIQKANLEKNTRNSKLLQKPNYKKGLCNLFFKKMHIKF
jgi:uncharacterized protein